MVSADPAPKKVVCVGGSLTWGYWADYPINRKTYPDQLATLLGPGYQLRNYGFNGFTAGRYPGQDNRAYILSGEHIGVLKWQPDVVISGLGINDCVSDYANPDLFEQGYRDLTAAWRSSGKNPSIWLWNRLSPDYRGPAGVPAYPGNVFGPKYVFTTDNNGIAANRPAVQAKADLLGPSLGIGMIDVYTPLCAMPEWAGEGLHLVEPGLKRLAEVIYCQAWNDQATSALPRLTEAAPNPGADSPSDENGAKPPWVELYNPYDYALSLDGLALDSGADSTRFSFTNSTVLWPGQRRVVFLSGKDRSLPTKNLHTNFTTSAADGQIRLLSRSGDVVDSIGWRNWVNTGSLGRADTVTTTAVTQDAPHARLLTTTPPANWQQPGFDASGWTSGTGGTGVELPARPEAQFLKRWSGDKATNPAWALAGPGWTAGDEPGTSKISGTDTYLNPPTWVSGNDASWTAEVRLKMAPGQTGSTKAFLMRGGTRHVGGTSATVYIQSDRIVFGEPYDSGTTISLADNSDDYHVFRMAYYAPTRTFFIWRDGVEVTSRTNGRTRDLSRSNWMAMGTMPFSTSVEATLDYASYDISGAYAPAAVNTYAATGNPATQPLVTDPTGPVSPNNTCLLRIPFDGSTHEAATLKLKVEFDDGFRAWLNGVEIASCNAPSSGNTAPQARDNSWGVQAMTLDVSDFKYLIQPTGNVLALQIFNAADSDNRCFGRASLDLVGPVGTIARYFSSTTAGTAGGEGSFVAPSQGWIYQQQSSGGSTLPLVLNLDSDGDGRSNLLEYSQGTNLSGFDNAPPLAAVQNVVSFLWRDNPEVGWRLMESTDQQIWRPATVSGAASSSGSSVPGFLQISQPVTAPAGKTYRLAAVEEPSLNTWRQRYFTAAEIADGTLTQDNADPDGDGLPNYVEFAIASDPKQPNTVHYLVATHQIAFSDPGTSRGATWYLESSPNLTTWNPIADPPVNCRIDPDSGRYELETLDPALSPRIGFMRIGYFPW